MQHQDAVANGNVPGSPQEGASRPALGAVRALLGMVCSAASVFVLQLVSAVLMLLLLQDVVYRLFPGVSADELALDMGAVALLAGQLVLLVVGMLWWRRMRPASALFDDTRCAHGTRRDTLCRIAGLFILGVGAQIVISLLLTGILPLFPSLEQEYSELMRDPSIGVFAVIALLTTTVGAPVTEEIFVRGIVFEYAARLTSPFHRRHMLHACEREKAPVSSALFDDAAGIDDVDAIARDERSRSAGIPVLTKRQFIVACLLQATVFAILHLNIVQSSYAFVIGIVEGYVFYRTGQLRWSILLHFVLNASSVLSALPAVVFNVVAVASVLLLPLGWKLFDLATPAARYRAEGGR